MPVGEVCPIISKEVETAMRKRIFLDQKQQRIYENLEKQINSVFKHNRQGSYKTKEKYQNDTKHFAKFLAKEFRLQNMRNISDKHLEKYVQCMQELKLAPSTIKDRLTAVRFFHDKLDHTRHILSPNQKFELERRQFGGVNRAWRDSEYKAFLKLCVLRENDRMASIAVLARNEGLRIHETLKIDRNAVEKALQKGELTVKGKGGKVRNVPLSQESREMLRERMQEIERGQKLFVQSGEKTHLVIKQCQNFINRNREYFQEERSRDQGESERISFHGLRHAYAQDRFEEFRKQGLNDYQARLAVSNLLGHERDDVTRIYTVK
jgi:site-specific recombinase XerC